MFYRIWPQATPRINTHLPFFHQMFKLLCVYSNQRSNKCNCMFSNILVLSTVLFSCETCTTMRHCRFMLASHELINSSEVDDVTLVERWGGGRYQCYLTALNLSLAKRPARIGRNATSCRSTPNMNFLTIFALAASVVAALGIPLTDTTLERDEMMGPDMMVGPELMIYPFKIEFKGKSYTPYNGNAFCQIPKTKYYRSNI